MFDIGWPELFIIAVVVLLVVGPKDLPRVLRTVGYYAGKAKAITREFRGHVDEMIRDSELENMQDELDAVSRNSLEEFSENSINRKDLDDFEYVEGDLLDEEGAIDADIADSAGGGARKRTKSIDNQVIYDQSEQTSRAREVDEGFYPTTDQDEPILIEEKEK
tara:strand:+ start:50 stop:538 length:489 start_codon:yes stop_codon:yes gene_type:complete